MRTLLLPPEGYPIALVGENIHVLDFCRVMEGATFPEAVAYIHADLRRRRTEGHYFPFASSTESVEKVFPGSSILIAPTHGWDNPGPLADTEEE